MHNYRTVFEAAREAGVRRIVHISIAKADAAPILPYYAGKAQAERELASVGARSIVRPTVVFGRGDVLVNNLAWLLWRGQPRERAKVISLPPGQPIGHEDIAHYDSVE